ncbi:dUTP diphosphatase [Magnetospirillum molischianum]|nr:dUTP diphosphatase [Magnetospirillum molischianum]
MFVIPFKKLDPAAVIPSYGSAGAAGMDLSSIEETIVAPGDRRLVKTGIAGAVPSGFYARIAPRSGLALKHGIDVLAGVVDEDYRGEIGVILINTGQTSFVVKAGDRIAQLIVEQIGRPAPIEVDDLPDTVRGAGGFGSTGV